MIDYSKSPTKHLKYVDKTFHNGSDILGSNCAIISALVS